MTPLSFVLLGWALLSTGAALLLARRLYQWRPAAPSSAWKAPTPDPKRYQVVFHLGSETRELYCGYDGLAARHAYETAPLEAGMRVEFYEFGQKRGSKSA